MAQIDHLVDAASEEIGGAAHRKTPRKPQQNSRKLGEMLAENDPKVVSDQCVMESSGTTIYGSSAPGSTYFYGKRPTDIATLRDVFLNP
jgi:hypothetical protein